MSSKPKSGGTIVTADDDATPLLPLESLTGFLLRCASNIADAAYYKHVGNAEITPRQFAILLSLRNGGHMTQAALSAVTRMDRSTINEMVPRMLRAEPDQQVEFSARQTGDPSLNYSSWTEDAEGAAPFDNPVPGNDPRFAPQGISAHLQALSRNDN